MFRELKARKAKFGFEYGRIRFNDVIPLADFSRSLDSAFGKDVCVFEESGYNEPVLKIYTDNDDVAHWIRNYVANAS